MLLYEPGTETIIGESENSDLRYLSFEAVRETHETVQRAATPAGVLTAKVYFPAEKHFIPPSPTRIYDDTRRS